MLLTTWYKLGKRQSESAKPSRRTGFRPRSSPKFQLEFLESRLAPATHAWTGGAGVGNLDWSNASNWTNGVPTSGESGGTLLVFPTVAAGLKTTVDDLPALTVDKITFSDGGYTVGGTGSNLLTLSGTLSPTVVDSAGGDTFAGSVGIVLTGANSFEIDAGTDSIAAVISGGGSLTKTGQNELDLTGANTFTGGTTLSAGTLSVGNNAALGTGTLALNGGTLQSSGPFTLANRFTVGGAATLSGNNSFTLSGAATLTAGSTLTVNNAGGTINLSGLLTGRER
jgi:autotransporter-associated beta strand protein